MKTYIKALTLLSCALFFTGCATTLKPTQLDETGYFDTDTKLKPDGLEIVEEFKPEYSTLLYVKTDDRNEKYNTFFLESFKNMDTFKNVLAKGELESLVLEKNLAGKVSNISDKIGLHSLSKEMGPFLVVEPYVEWKGGYNFIANLKAIDPTTGKEVLVLNNEAFNWSGLDQPLFYPLFNAFLEWSRNDEITTKAAKKKLLPRGTE